MQTTPQSKSSDRLLRASEILQILGVSNATLWRLIQRGEFPRSIKLGRAARWEERDVRAFIATRKAQSEKAA